MTATKRSVISDTARSGRSQVGGLVLPELAQQVELDALADGDRAGAVGDLDAVEQQRRAVVGRHVAEADWLVEVHDVRAGHRQCTILAIGTSRRSVAPASLSAGITRLIPRFSTSVSTANPPPASCDTV